MGGGVYPCPNFLALFLEVHFWSIKRVYFFKRKRFFSLKPSLSGKISHTSSSIYHLARNLTTWVEGNHTTWQIDFCKIYFTFIFLYRNSKHLANILPVQYYYPLGARSWLRVSRSTLRPGRLWLGDFKANIKCSIPKPQVRDWFDKKSSEVVPADEHDSQEGGGWGWENPGGWK